MASLKKRKRAVTQDTRDEPAKSRPHPKGKPERQELKDIFSFDLDDSDEDGPITLHDGTDHDSPVELSPTTFLTSAGRTASTGSVAATSKQSGRKQSTLESLIISPSRATVSRPVKSRSMVATSRQPASFLASSQSATGRARKATSLKDPLFKEPSDDDPIDDTEDLPEVGRRPPNKSETEKAQKKPSMIRFASRPVSQSEAGIDRPQSQASQSFAVSSISSRLPKPEPNQSDLWVEKYAPKDSISLALHKKKFEDVKQWLKLVFSSQLKQRVLLLSGPAGASKTAVLSVLARELGFDIIEWTNPASPADYELGAEYVSFSSMFSDFLSKAQQFSSTMTTIHDDYPDEEIFDLRASTLRTSRKRIILIEDLPNVLFTSTQARKSFLDAIAAYLCAERSQSPPLVIIVSELESRDEMSGPSAFTAESILGRDILGHPRLTRIQFNTVNKTLMTRVLREIATKEGYLSGKKKDRKQAGINLIIEKLAESGDVRSAINALQWWATTGGQLAPLGRETYLEFFHAIGKVLYNSSEKVGEHSVEDAIMQAVPVTLLVPSIFENYPSSCDDALELERCAVALSDSDLFLNASGRKYGRAIADSTGDSVVVDLSQYGAEISIRGVMGALRPQPITRKPVSIKDFVSTRAERQPKTALELSSSMCKPLGFHIYRRQQDVMASVSRYLASSKRARGITDRGVLSSETATDFMTNIAFWEALIRRDDLTRKFGGRYDGLTINTEEDGGDEESEEIIPDFGNTIDTIGHDISGLFLSDDDIEE